MSLAISLHAVNDALVRRSPRPCVRSCSNQHVVCCAQRDVLVPINKQFPIKMLLEACRRYPGVKPSRSRACARRQSHLSSLTGLRVQASDVRVRHAEGSERFDCRGARTGPDAPWHSFPSKSYSMEQSKRSLLLLKLVDAFRNVVDACGVLCSGKGRSTRVPVTTRCTNSPRSWPSLARPRDGSRVPSGGRVGGISPRRAARYRVQCQAALIVTSAAFNAAACHQELAKGQAAAGASDSGCGVMCGTSRNGNLRQ